MLQAADAIDSSKPAGLAKTAEKQGSSKVRNPNEALLTAPVLINLDVEHMESEIFVAFRGGLKNFFLRENSETSSQFVIIGELSEEER